MNDNTKPSVVKFSADYIYKKATGIQNIFLSEFLKNAPEIPLKVYLYGMFLISNTNETRVAECSDDVIAKNLGITKEEVATAFLYWEDLNAVKIRTRHPLFVEYLDLASQAFRPAKFDPRKYEDFNIQLSAMLTGRMINPGEYVEYYNFMEAYRFPQESFLQVVAYAIKRNGRNASSRFIMQTAINLKNKNIKEFSAVNAEFTNYFMQSSVASDLLSAMKIKRKVEMEDMQYLKKWKEMGYDESALVAAAKLLKGSKSMEKFDSVILELFSSKIFEEEEIVAYQKHKNMLYELAIKLNKAIGVYVEVLETVVDVYVRKWVDVYGFSDDALLYIAESSFLSGVRTLEGLSDKVDSFFKMGICTKQGLLLYMQEFIKTEEKIKKILDILGYVRRPNGYDRNCYNGFTKLGTSDELIEFSAEKAVGTHKPYPYMYSILKNWQKGGVLTRAEAEKIKLPQQNAVGTAKKAEISAEFYTKEEIASAFSALENLQEF